MICAAWSRRASTGARSEVLLWASTSVYLLTLCLFSKKLETTDGARVGGGRRRRISGLAPSDSSRKTEEHQHKDTNRYVLMDARRRLEQITSRRWVEGVNKRAYDAEKHGA